MGMTENESREEPRPQWTMPSWMEPYREYFYNTGGDTIENLMNDHHCQNNLLRAALVACAESQVMLLERLRATGKLDDSDSTHVGDGFDEATIDNEMLNDLAEILIESNSNLNSNNSKDKSKDNKSK